MPRQRHDPTKNLVGFLVGDVAYAVRIEAVREILNPLDVVELPRAPSAVRGVASFRSIACWFLAVSESRIPDRRSCLSIGSS